MKAIWLSEKNGTASCSIVMVKCRNPWREYEAWFGQLYTPSRYEYRGKVANTRFERECLSGFAEVFKTVCVDGAYYTFPSENISKLKMARFGPAEQEMTAGAYYRIGFFRQITPIRGKP